MAFFGTFIYTFFSILTPSYKNVQNLTLYKNGQNFDPLIRNDQNVVKIARILSQMDKVVTLLYKTAKVLPPPIQKTAKIWTPLHAKMLKFYAVTKTWPPYKKVWPRFNKMTFSGPPIQKVAFSRPLYKKMHFWDSPIQKIRPLPLPILNEIALKMKNHPQTL